VAVQYTDNGSTRSAGLRVWDRPTDAPLEAQFALAERMLSTPPGRCEIRSIASGCECANEWRALHACSQAVRTALRSDPPRRMRAASTPSRDARHRHITRCR
jgi:hypothetical protein